MDSVDGFRLGMQRLVSGVSVITGRSAEGRPYGITATSVFSLTVDPPSLAVGVNRQTRLGGIVPELKTFSVSILGDGQREVAEAFAGRIPGIKGVDRFTYGRWSEDPSGVPILLDAAACFACEVDGIMERSTHFLLIGVVTAVHVSPGDIAPLVYFSREFVDVRHGAAAQPPLARELHRANGANGLPPVAGR
jgi:3-hydroxy-9,10-secoandrosta-1,3,5(10)-triene-9,17-dione monooxygenase reductase component